LVWIESSDPIQTNEIDLGERVFDNQNGFEYWSAPKLQLAALLGFVGIALLAGFASASVASVNMRGWYAFLTPPPFAPPAPLPASAWGLMGISYLLMAVAAWRVWRQMTPIVYQRSALNAWGWQLALGAAWPAVFFGFHSMLAALIIAAALVLAVGLTIRRFARLDNAAAVLLIPHLVSAGFASYLNAGFWWLNH
jgi:translocator protein